MQICKPICGMRRNHVSDARTDRAATLLAVASYMRCMETKLNGHDLDSEVAEERPTPHKGKASKDDDINLDLDCCSIEVLHWAKC
jgi:hypothetical protein